MHYHILRDLSEYATLAFIARNLLLVFQYRRLRHHSTSGKGTLRWRRSVRISWLLAELLLQLEEKDEFFVDGCVSLSKDLSLCCQRVSFADVTSRWTVSALLLARVDACKVLTDAVGPGGLVAAVCVFLFSPPLHGY